MKYDKPTILTISLVICLALASPSAFAAPKEGHDTPPGWSHGKKTGWDGENLPPGLAKKEGIEKGDDVKDEAGEKVEKEKKEHKKQKEDAEKAVKQEKEKKEKEAKEKGKEASKEVSKKKSRFKRMWPFGKHKD